jgi:lipid II:glycine glycyltransferase (peptidoglycan interpeptide bridge formation enzyme)
MVSLPFSYICGPIADSASILNELIDKAKDLSHRLGCNYLELRMDQPFTVNLVLNSYFSTYVLELEAPAVVWKKLHQKGVRWAIGKARKDGVAVRQDKSLGSIETFFGLNQKTKKKLGVPAHPFNFLKDIIQKLPELSKIYLAEVEGKPVAGIITISFKDTVCYAYGASDSKYLKYHPNDLLIWNAIEESCNNGYRYFDFGKTAPDDEGLSRFKKHWGTEQKPLYYYYHPKLPKLMSSNRTGIKYRFVTGVWKGLPEFVTQSLSSLAFKQLD